MFGHQGTVRIPFQKNYLRRFDACQRSVNLVDLSYESSLKGVLPKLIARSIGVLALKILGEGGLFGAHNHGSMETLRRSFRIA